jgi:hypothetical protein
VIDKACRGSKVPLRAFWCKARVPMADRLRQATEIEEAKVSTSSVVFYERLLSRTKK